MKHYVYTKNGKNIITTMTKDYAREELLAWAKAHTPAGCPIFLLTNDELAELAGSPIEAVAFDASQADGKGEVEE